jgi:hypothetical protein
MLVIEYQPNAVWPKAAPDARLVEFAEAIIEDYKEFCPAPAIFVKTISSQLMIDAFRLCVKRGLIDPKDFRFKFQGELLEVNENGKLPVWPPGFGDAYSKLLRELM